MRLKGTLVEWNDDRGFGFIEPEGGGARVFCHIKAFEVRVRRPIAGDRVTYELSKGSDGRTSAARVRPVGLDDASYQSNVGTKFKKDREQRNNHSPKKSWKFAVIVLLLAVGAGSYVFTNQDRLPSQLNRVGASQSQNTQSDAVLRQAYERQRSNIQVQGEGNRRETVVRRFGWLAPSAIHHTTRVRTNDLDRSQHRSSCACRINRSRRSGRIQRRVRME